MDDERQKDIDAAVRILGYTRERMQQTPNADAIYAPGSVVEAAIVFDSGTIYGYDIPHFEKDRNAAALLFEALSPEAQAKAVEVLAQRLEIDIGSYRGLAALLAAPPSAIRDACLEALA